MAFVRTVSRYSAFLYPNRGKQEGRINLYCNPDKLYIIFRDPSEPLSNNSYNETNQLGVAYQKFDQYQNYLDLVRNEKPIYVTFRPEDSPPNFVMYCASEPPGEGEI